MIPTIVLVVVGIFQVLFIIGTFALLVVANRHGRRDDKTDSALAAKLRGPARALMLGTDEGQLLAGALAKLPRNVAARQLRAIAATQLGPDQRAKLAGLVRNSRWVKRTLADGTSQTWWKRMDAARLLSVVSSADYISLLQRLVRDPHPAVMSAATAAIGGFADIDLITIIVDGLADTPPTVRLQQMVALKSHSGAATQILVRRLESSGGSPDQIGALIQLAEVLGTPQALAAVVPYASHPDSEVRVTVARALRTCFSQAGVEAARSLLDDGDWRVRATAARALASLNDAGAIPALRRALNDESWWVRFRSALALGDFGADGEQALASAAISDDDYARDIAVFVGGLSQSARIELST